MRATLASLAGADGAARATGAIMIRGSSRELPNVDNDLHRFSAAVTYIFPSANLNMRLSSAGAIAYESKVKLKRV